MSQEKQAKTTGMRDKPACEMTAEELRQFMKPLGKTGMPFPTAFVKEEGDNKLECEVGMINSDNYDEIMWIPSEQSVERVYGQSIRGIATPQMMFAHRQLVSCMQPDAKNVIIAIKGERASGKSRMIDDAGSLVHPQGAIKLDCGGMNMHELFWRTIIDYGKGTKEQLEKKLADGKLLPSSIDIFKQEFPDSIVTVNGRQSINWDAFGARRMKPAKEEGEATCDESFESAAQRAKKVLDLVYQKEGLAKQDNAYGIVTVPGVLHESFETGRPIKLDEFNKSLRGSLDAWQGFLEWANGNDSDPVFRIPNPMGTSDGDSLNYIEFDRRKKKLGWFIAVLGNDETDGITTQPLSVSMEDRLSWIRVGDPTLNDWTCRYSQILTGLPLTLFCDFFAEDRIGSPDAFERKMMELRTMGLTPTERKLIPPHQMAALSGFNERTERFAFQDTYEAVGQIAKGYFEQQQLGRENSAKIAEQNQTCQTELAHGRGHIRVSFRTAIQELNKALKASLKVVAKGSLSLLQGSFTEAVKSACTYGAGVGHAGWYKLGQNLVRVRQEAIANATVDMPVTSAALVSLWKLNGVFPPGHQEARRTDGTVVKNICDLLSYDDAGQLGDTIDLEKKRDVMMAMLKSMNPGMEAPAEQVIPLRNLAIAAKAIEKASRNEASQQTAASEETADQPILLPNDNLDEVADQPILQGMAVLSYGKTASAEYKLVDFRTALAALAMPGYAQKNREALWPKDILDQVRKSQQDLPEDQRSTDEVLQEDYGLLTGAAPEGLGLWIIETAGETEEKSDFLYVLSDSVRDAMLVAGPAPISKQLEGLLAENGISYFVKDDLHKFPSKEVTLEESRNAQEAERAAAALEDTEEEDPNEMVNPVNKFMQKGFTVRYEKNMVEKEDDVYRIQHRLLRTFSAVCIIPGAEEAFAIGSSVPGILRDCHSPQYYTSFVAGKKPAMS